MTAFVPCRAAAAFVLLATLTLAGCSGSSSGGGAPDGDFLLGDATVDELLAFEATATSLRLRNDDGDFTTDLLASPVRLEFLGLSEVSAWIASGTFEKDSYAAVELQFDAASVEATAKDGSDVTVTVLSNTLLATLPATTPIGSGYRRFLIDLDLGESLEGDVSMGAITFDPTGLASVDKGEQDDPIDEIEGVVQSFDVSARTLVLAAYAEGDPNLSLGDVLVSLNQTSTLLDELGSLFVDPGSFFASLVTGTTVVEVHGDLGSKGSVVATRAQIEDQSGGGGLTLVRIEGIILELNAGVDFELLIREVEKGADVADPVLSGLGDPASITVSFGLSTIVVTDAGTITDASALATGQEVKVKFAEFATEPFPAFFIEVEDLEPRLEAMSVDVTGLPDAIVVQLDDDEPAVLSGDVDSSTTNVDVDLTASTFLLEAEGDPALVAGDLLIGLELRIRGTLSGPSNDPDLAATEVEVRPGELEGAFVTGSDRIAATFTTSGGEIEDPFGGAATSGPFTVLIEAGCVFSGDVTSAEAFHDAVAEMGQLDTIVVELSGLGTDQPGVLRAFEVEVGMESED